MAPEELVAWQRRCGFRTDAEAAAKLGIAVGTYRQKRTGRASITKQTEILCAYVEMFYGRWIDAAETARRLARLTSSARDYRV